MVHARTEYTVSPVPLSVPMAVWLTPALAALLLYGIGQGLVKKWIGEVSPARFCLYYVLATSVVNFGFFFTHEHPPLLAPGGRQFLEFGVLAYLFDGMAWILYFQSVVLGPVAIVGTLSAAYPALTIIFARVFLSEALTPLQYLAVTLVICGGLGLSYAPASGEGTITNRRWIPFALLALLGWATSNTLIKYAYLLPAFSDSERRVVLKDRSQPLYLEGYHRPGYLDKDDAIYDAIADLMSNGRTSRLYRTLVRDKKIAADSAGFSGRPGVKYPHLFAFYAFPLPGHTPQEMADAIHAEIEKLKTTDITDDELKMIKTRAKASLLRGLGSNEGLATQLATYQAMYGDWHELFKSVDRIDQVSKADIRRVATETFVPANRTFGIIETMAPPKPAAAAQGGGQ